VLVVELEGVAASTERDNRIEEANCFLKRPCRLVAKIQGHCRRLGRRWETAFGGLDGAALRYREWEAEKGQ
jgi:hypothetical protein